MAISANSIIHYTKEFNTLLEILSNSAFQVSYASEKIITRGKKNFFVAIPMVSFCDIPLTEYKKHFYKPNKKNALGYYGDYGIGLTKKWATANGLNPVLYIDNNSFVGTSLRHNVEQIENGIYNNSNSNAIELFPCYTKNYQGVLKRKTMPEVKAYRFYDEREWRYVPPKETLGNNRLFIPEKEYDQNRPLHNDRLQGIMLKFSYADISYIVLKNEEEIPLLINFLGDKYHNKQTTFFNKVLTSQQIIHDF